MKNLLRNLAFSLLSFLLFLLLLEGGIRLGVALLSERITRVDPVLGWTHVPGASKKITLEDHPFTLTYNDHGYRVPAHDYARTPGVRRIVILGDSFVDGSEVGDTETFTWIMQQNLPGVEVINLGVYGFGTTQQLRMLETVALRYRPDLVISMTMTNDFTDNLLNFSFFGTAPRFVWQGDSLVFQETDHPAALAAFRQINLPVPGWRFLLEHSYLYYFLNAYLYRKLIARKIDALIREQKAALPRAQQEKLYLEITRRMSQVCRVNGIDFLVVFAYPQKFLLENPHSPSGPLVRALHEMDIATLDLFAPLKDAETAGGPSLYYVKDFHWNTRGHRLVAEILGKWVQNWQQTREAVQLSPVGH